MPEMHNDAQQPGYLQRAVKTLSQKTKALLSPWTQRRLDVLHERGEAEGARPLTMTYRNTQQLLRRVRQTREQAVAWKPDIGALTPGLVKRFSSAIADRTQTLRLIGIRRQPAAPAPVWDSNLELILPVSAAAPAGQVIERFAPSTAQGPSIFTAGQPIEPFKPTAPIPGRSPRPTSAPKPTRKPAQKQLPPQARLYARVQEIAPHDEMPERETREPLAAQVTPRETPQPARESPSIQRTPAQEISPAEQIAPPAAVPSVTRVQRQAERTPPSSPERPAIVTPRQPERRQTPTLPVQRVAAPDATPAPHKPAPTAPLPPEITPSQPATAMPLAATASPVEPTPSPAPIPFEAPGIQRAAEIPAPRTEPRQPPDKAPAIAQAVTPTEPATRTPRAIAEPALTKPATQARPPHALPTEPPASVAEPAQRTTAPAIPRAAADPGAHPRPEPPATPQAPPRASTPPARPVEAPQPQPPRQPVIAASQLQARPVTPEVSHVETRRATEPTPVQAAPSERAEAQPPFMTTTPPELRPSLTPPSADLAAPAELTPQPQESIQTPPTPIPPSPAAGEPPRDEIVLPLRQIIQRRAEVRSHGLLRKPASPPTLRPIIARMQPQAQPAATQAAPAIQPHQEAQTPTTRSPFTIPYSPFSPTLYARSPNLYIGPGPALTVIRIQASPQAQQRAHDDRPEHQPPMDLRTAMSTLPRQESYQASAVSSQPSAFSRQPAATDRQQEGAERSGAMPLARQQPVPSPVQTPRPPARTVEPVARPSVVGELVQREAIVQRVEEENEAPDSINLGELAHRVYPFVKRLIAVERERMAR